MTDNHSGFKTQSKGDQDWHIPLNDTIEALDVEVPVRDAESNLSNYTPKANATFIATDSGAIYSGDGSSWYREDWVVSDFEAKDSITFPDGTTVTSPGSGSAVDFEEDGSAVVQNASAANFIEAGASTVNVTDDGDGSVTVEVSSTDTNTERTDEEIEDTVASLVGGGSNITTTYNDAGDTFTIDGLTDEQIEDLVGAMAGNNLAYDDGNGLLNATDTTRTDEEIEDVVGSLVQAGSNTTVTYDDAANTLTITASGNQLTEEEVEDIIGGAINVGLSYDDVNNEINLTSTDVTVAGNTVSLGGTTAVDHADLSNIGAADHHSRYTDEESQDAVGTILGANFTYSDATPAINLANDTVTVAGNAVSLGGTTIVNHADLSNIGSADHHTRYADEEAQDAVGNIFGATLQYSDSAPSMNVADGSIGTTQLSTPFELYDLVTTPIDAGQNDIVADASTIWDDSASELVANINATLAAIDTLTIPDTASQPASAGEITQDSGDVYVYSGGSVKNISNIGTGSGGAPADAAYLTLQSDSGLSNETIVDSYPFSLATDTDLDFGPNDVSIGDPPVLLWDDSNDHVPQPQLAGPASSLTAYPLPASDLDTESFEDEVGGMAGSGLSYDDVNGQLETTASGASQVNVTNDYTLSINEAAWVDTSSQSVNIVVTLPPPQDSGQVWIDAVNTSGGTVSIEDNGGEQVIIGNNDYGGANQNYELVEGEVLGLLSNGSVWRGGY